MFTNNLLLDVCAKEKSAITTTVHRALIFAIILCQFAKMKLAIFLVTSVR